MKRLRLITALVIVTMCSVPEASATIFIIDGTADTRAQAYDGEFGIGPFVNTQSISGGAVTSSQHDTVASTTSIYSTSGDSGQFSAAFFQTSSNDYTGPIGINGQFFPYQFGQTSTQANFISSKPLLFEISLTNEPTRALVQNTTTLYDYTANVLLAEIFFTSDVLATTYQRTISGVIQAGHNIGWYARELSSVSPRDYPNYPSAPYVPPFTYEARASASLTLNPDPDVPISNTPEPSTFVMFAGIIAMAGIYGIYKWAKGTAAAKPVS